jgi:hypothetical protein
MHAREAVWQKSRELMLRTFRPPRARRDSPAWPADHLRLADGENRQLKHIGRGERAQRWAIRVGVERSAELR